MPMQSQRMDVHPADRPVLDLSGPKLANHLASLVEASEASGGVEHYTAALAFKSSVFAEALAGERVRTLTEERFIGLCAFIAPVRRRVGAYLDQHGYRAVQEPLARLFEGAEDTTTTDRRLARFCAAFPPGRAFRWVRDLGSELLHQTDPERYPLMTRWIWDRTSNTGVLREIWHADDLDHLTLEVGDHFETYLMLREELSEFLSRNGVYRDVPAYVELLCAHVYSGYIAEQGGTYLRADFNSELDRMEHTRRMLGLDGIDPNSGKTRVKMADGRPYYLDTASLGL